MSTIMPPTSKGFLMDEFRRLPFELLDSFRPANIIARGYPLWTFSGDTGAFVALFFDNLATILSLFGYLAVIGFPMDFVYQHFAGGLGVSLFLGNMYYSLQASKVARRTGRMNTCAQPYGINTAGSTAKTFGILYPTFLQAISSGKTREDAANHAWQVACNANFFCGLMEVLGAVVGPFMRANLPEGALLVPLGGIGLTFLGANSLLLILESPISKNPVAGFLPMIFIWTGFFGVPRLFGPLSSVGSSVFIGIVLNVLVQSNDPEGYWERVEDATASIGLNGLRAPGWSYASEAWDEHGSLWLSLACTSLIATLSCCMSARRVGDMYSPVETMVVDGLGTMIGALCGSPYGTTVYVGIVAYKKMGATRGYSVLNGTLWLLIGFFGLHGIIQAIVPNEVVAGLLMAIGYSVAQNIFESTPNRWYPALLLGVCLSALNYTGCCMESPVLAVKYFQNGNYILMVSYTFLFMMLTDRWFLAAVGALCCLAFFSFFGIIHASRITYKYNNWLTLHGSTLGEEDGFVPGNSGQVGWKLWFTYFSGAGLVLLFYVLQKLDLIEGPLQEDFREVQARAAAPLDMACC